MERRRTRTPWVFVGLWVAVIAVGSLAPGLGAPAGGDLGLHGLAYLVLAWLLRRAIDGRGLARGTLLPAAIAWGFGLLMEGLQAALPYRAAEARDLAANTAGVLVAVVLPVGRTRGGRRAATAAAVVLASALTLAGVGGPRGLGQPAAPGQPPGGPPPVAGVTQVGVPAVDASALAGVRGAGARVVRILADWSVIEPQRGTLAWGDVDRMVAAAGREGLTPVVVLAHTPRWASIGTGVDLMRPEIYSRQPPRDIRDWERFVAAAAARYRGRVGEWQVWSHLGLPHFRGTGTEYAALLRTARARLREADPAARVALATPVGIDLMFVVRMTQEASAAFDAVALTADGLAPEALLRPLAVLDRRVREAGKALWLEWRPEGGGSADGVAALWSRMLAVAQAAGVERLFVPAPGRIDAGLTAAAAALARRPAAGYLARGPDILVPAFGAGPDAALLAWATAEDRALEVPAGTTLRVTTTDGREVPVEVREGQAALRLSGSPLLIVGLPPALVEEARATVASRGPLLPPVSLERDYSRALEVAARLGRMGEERGLYNRLYRSRRNGAVEPVEIDGTEAVRTSVARQVLYVYFDVDDSFLYFVEGRTPIEITVEVLGARAPNLVGFNLLYDSTGGYRFTPWQWVDVREGWVSHTIRLTDASLANTWGWDFAINTAGNRADDLVVKSVIVRKGGP